MERFLGALFKTLSVLAVAAVGFFAIAYLQPPREAAGSKILSEGQPFQADFSVSVNPHQTFAVGILGESRGDESKGEAFHKETLKQLLAGLSDHHAKAIFFTGNLVSGIGKRTPADNEFESTPEIFMQQLHEFSSVFQGVVGDKIPLFPIMGDREQANAAYSVIFREHFHLGRGHLLGKKAFGYTVSVGNAYFVLIGSDEYQSQRKKGEPSFGPDLQAWMDRSLKEASNTFKYLFVIGHEPVFSTQSTFGESGADQREAFWKVLVDNGVLAYFGSHELLFDRSNRRGVWHVISGGGGASFDTDPSILPFYHALLLSIPPQDQAVPRVDILSEKGEVVEGFELKNVQSPVYQMRIS